MNTSTFRNAKYEALGETWCRHQAARILSRHLQFGKHCRLDLDTLLAGIARTLRHEIPDGAPGEKLLETTIGDAADGYPPSRQTTTGSGVLSAVRNIVPGRSVAAPGGGQLESKY